MLCPVPGTEVSSNESGVVFLVDDDPGVRTALSRLLRSHGITVRAYDSATAFLDDLPESDCCCVLLDVKMPDLTGPDLQARMADLGIRYPIVFITGYGNVPTSVRAMKAGAVDFLEKPFDERELLAAIDRGLALHRRLGRDHEANELLRHRTSRLTPREVQVMQLVASGSRNKHVAEQLGITVRTVKAHRGQVMKKMEARSLPELVRMVEHMPPGGNGATAHPAFTASREGADSAHLQV